ncbi:uncharacterized protein BDR25DRAFT_347169 [Lindgomyces ingoldianus]|uniref:Uncharacterized protein n=1 Tax=Lindgomyces ingoldianus TaxID=673940 RepID=A0ACB6QBJ1_9PLEO|nr:uncharacterized protein BDR25DRAFT_347169 [Lindgomyces ingoldianus]KAF2463521.1 hypothetical protein BDR25DRAFT_347169 [Lindgomyces ingoldianus]
MPLELHPITECDFSDVTRIQLAAFDSGIAHMLFPDPMTPEKFQESVDRHVKCFKSEPDVHYLKVIDTDQNGKMISAAKWRINETERTEEEIQTQLPTPGRGGEATPAAVAFRQHLCDSRKEFMGTKPFYYPEHHRRGAGAMLVKWGIEKADQAQLPSYLEASEIGKVLYVKLGFYPVKERLFDMTQYGADGIDCNTVMLRDPPK